MASRRGRSRRGGEDGAGARSRREHGSSRGPARTEPGEEGAGRLEQATSGAFCGPAVQPAGSFLWPGVQSAAVCLRLHRLAASVPDEGSRSQVGRADDSPPRALWPGGECVYLAYGIRMKQCECHASLALSVCASHGVERRLACAREGSSRIVSSDGWRVRGRGGIIGASDALWRHVHGAMKDRSSVI